MIPKLKPLTNNCTTNKKSLINTRPYTTKVLLCKLFLKRILSYMKSEHYVFIVDDDPSARRGIARLLRAAGHNVRVYASANEFLEIITKDDSGCLVLDARMPGMSGDELKAELNRRCIDLSIIVITGDDDPETKRKADKIKAVGFFRKPVDGAALLDAVEWALRSGSTNSNHTNM